MSGRGLAHARVRFSPDLSAILTAANAAFVIQHRIVPPHLGARKIMGVAIHAPHPASHLGIEGDPVSGVQPLTGNTGRRTSPRNAAIFTAEKSYICVTNELAFEIERIEVNPITVSNIEARAGPSCVIYLSGILRNPGSAPVAGPHGSSEIRPIRQTGILLSYS